MLCGLPEDDEEHSEDPDEPWKHSFIPQGLKCAACGEGPFHGSHHKLSGTYHAFVPDDGDEP